MAIEVALWREHFPEKELPSWPCPKCSNGRLGTISNEQRTWEPAYSESNKSDDAWEPEWVTLRFVSVLKCTNPPCGEYVIVSGDTEATEYFDDMYGPSYETSLRPKCIFPAPPIIDLPDKTPETVSRHLKLAFQLFWSDLGASANRLRSSVERLLDEFGISKTTKDKNKKRRPLPLATRINLLKTKKPALAENLDALRIVGNLGTHTTVSREALLAAFEIYEHTLAELYEKRSDRISKLVKKIKKSKGKLKG